MANGNGRIARAKTAAKTADKARSSRKRKKLGKGSKGPAIVRGLALTALTTPASALDDRTRVLLSLDSKRIALFDAEHDLRARLPDAANAGQRGALFGLIQEVIEEAFLVEARFTAIQADGAFTPLPVEEEQALLDAIREAGRRADQNAALTQLMRAVSDLVGVYKAADTE